MSHHFSSDRPDFPPASGYVRLDTERTRKKMAERQLSARQLAEEARLNLRTITAALSGKRIQVATAQKIAELLEVPVFAILKASKKEPEKLPPRHFREWTVIRSLSRTLETSNRIEFQVHQLQHRHIPKLFGRGKRFDISYMTPEQQKTTTELVTRHPLVCRRLEGCSQFPRNESVSLEGDQNCWVIDAWEEAAPLPAVISDRGLTESEIPGVALDLLNGLNALHENSIVRRELLPEFIWLRDDHSVLLTELELAKLTDGSPTVSREWAEKPYLAPEIYRGGDVTPAADLYSWARIVWFMLTREEPRRQATPQDFDRFDFPLKIRRILSQCVETSPTLRPKSVAAILPDVSDWAGQ